MNMTLVSVLLSLLLLLLLETGPVMTALFHSVQIVSYHEARKTQNGPAMCALDQANETTSSSSLEDCSLKCAHDGTCTGFNIKNSLTCDHINTPVLASTSRTHSPVITSIHLYWLQHQELTHLWSHQYTCTGFNMRNDTDCDVYNYKPKITYPISSCTYYQVSSGAYCLHIVITCVLCLFLTTLSVIY